VFGAEIYFMAFISAVLIALSVYVRYVKAGRQLDVSDPFYMCALFFVLYFVVGQLDRITIDAFPPDVYLRSGLIVLSCSVVFLLSSSLCNVYKAADDCGIIYSYSMSKTLVVSAIIALGVGYLFWYLNYSRLGSIMSIFADHTFRGERNARLTEMRGNLPYAHFLYVGYMFLFSSLLLRKATVKKTVQLSVMAVLPLLIFYLLEGERTALLKYILGGFYLVALFRFKRTISFSKKAFAVVAIMYLLFSVVGNFRGPVFYYLVTGESDNLQRMANRERSVFISNEFPGVYFTLNKTIYDMNNASVQPLYGSSYLQAIPYLFPRSVYDLIGVEKSGTVADEFGDRVASEIGTDNKVGFGMLALAEAYRNIMFVGPLIFTALYVLFVSLWAYMAKRSKGKLKLIILAMTSPLFVFMYRSGFASCFSFSCYVIFISLAIYCPVRFLMSMQSVCCRGKGAA